MDVFIPIIIFSVIFFLFCLCGARARKRRNQNGAIFSTPVIVTNATHQLPAGASAYPVTVAQGTGQASYPIQPNATIYTTHQVQGFGVYQMPQPQHQQQPGFSYPPMSYPPQSQSQPPIHPGQFVAGPQFNPPTYDQVIGGGGGAGAGMQQAGYQKQSPYNPGYSGN